MVSSRSIASVATMRSERRGVSGFQVRAGVASSPRTNTMQYKKLGDSDLVISEITLGTVRIFIFGLGILLVNS